MGLSRAAAAVHFHRLPKPHSLPDGRIRRLPLFLFPLPTGSIFAQKNSVYIRSPGNSFASSSSVPTRKTPLRALCSSATEMVKAIRVRDLGGPEVSVSIPFVSAFVNIPLSVS